MGGLMLVGSPDQDDAVHLSGATVKNGTQVPAGQSRIELERTILERHKGVHRFPKNRDFSFDKDQPARGSPHPVTHEIKGHPGQFGLFGLDPSPGFSAPSGLFKQYHE